MEKYVDTMLDTIFGGVGLQLNLIGGLVVLVAGIVVLAVPTKQPSKSKKIVGWVCVGLGCLGALSGAAQLFLR